MNDSKKQIPWTALLALAIAIGGTFLFRQMLRENQLTPATFISAFAILCSVSLAIYGFPRLKEFELLKGRFTLERMETIRKEIYAKEEDLKRLSLLLTDSILMSSVWLGRVGSEETNRLKTQWFSQQAQQIISVIQSSKSDREHLLRFVRLFQKMDSIDNLGAANRDSQERKAVWNELVAALQKEVHDRAQIQKCD
jgi:hypothetical protein